MPKMNKKIEKLPKPDRQTQGNPIPPQNKLPFKIGILGSDKLRALGIESEKVIDKIYLQIIEFLSDDKHIRKFTVLTDYNDLKNIMSIEVLHTLFLRKYCKNQTILKKFDNLLLYYQQYLISNNDGRGRRDYVQLFTGTGGDSSPTFNIRKMLIDKLREKKGLGETT